MDDYGRTWLGRTTPRPLRGEAADAFRTQNSSDSDRFSFLRMPVLVCRGMWSWDAQQKHLSPTSCSFRLPRIFYSGSLHLSGKLDSNPPLPLTDLPGTPRDTEVKSDVHLVGWISRVGDLLRYVDPMSFLHGDGHKVIPSNGGREVGENWGEKV